MFSSFSQKLGWLTSQLKSRKPEETKPVLEVADETQPSRNPFKQELLRLANERGQTLDIAIDNPELQETMRQLADEQAKNLNQFQEARAKAVAEVERKRKADLTAHDIQVWWGQSVGTWSDEDSKNVENIDKKLPPRQASHWAKK